MTSLPWKSVAGSCVLLVALGSVWPALCLSPSAADDNKKPAPKTVKATLRKAAVTWSSSAFAVVELFTSEGCSSCPPAEAVVNKLAKDHKTDRVITLAYHVDYWDNLGWKDRFGSKAYSRYQRRYALKFRNKRIYTPQMIVNGQVEFVGSRSQQAKKEIKRALLQTPKVKLGCAWNATSKKLIVETKGLSQDAQLRILVIESGLQTQVKAGENNGRSLSHESVVRSMNTLKWGKKDLSDALDVALPKSVNLDQSALVVLLQDTKTFKILAAQRLTLKSKKSKSNNGSKAGG